MRHFKKTEIIRFPDARSVDPGGGDESWSRWEHPTTIKEYGAINKIDISSQSPHHLAITSYSKVTLYNPVIRDVYKTVAKFQDAAYGAKFRRDGKLFGVGTSEGQLKIFDFATKTLLRILRGHTTAVHRLDFTSDNTHVLSFSDDKTVGFWDLAAETLTDSYSEHTDYIRCGFACMQSPDLFLSGSYDQTVRMWDRRTGTNSVLTFNHGAPVEDLVVMPGDSLLVSAGGTKVKIWDIAGGGRELITMNPHHKTVTCLCLASDKGGNCGVVSGSLDRHAKLHDLQSFKVTGSLSFPNSLLSVGVCNDFVVGGMVDGIVQIYNKREDGYVDGVKVESKKEVKRRNHRYLKYTHFEAAPGDIVVDAANRNIELRHDTLLRKYEMSKALDQTLKPYVQRKKPEYAHSLLYELIRRESLRTALTGRDDRSLLLVLSYLNKYLLDQRFFKVLSHVANEVIDLYLRTPNMSENVLKSFNDMRKKLERELAYIEEMSKLQGVLNLVISAASSSTEPVEDRLDKEIVARTS